MSLLEREVAIVVPSCDAYSDLWATLFDGLRIHWPTCPFPKYLVSNQMDSTSNDVVSIRVGRDRGWCANLTSALSCIPQEYVFLFIDDLILRAQVDHSMVMRLIEHCVRNEWDYLRLNPTPAPPARLVSNGIGCVPAGDWYRASTVFSVWKKAVLADVLSPEENAWELEVLGSARTDKYKRWFACSNWNLPYYNLVIKGKIDPRVLSRLRSMGIHMPLGRTIMNPWECGLHSLRRVRSAFMNFVPRKARRRARSMFAAH